MAVNHEAAANAVRDLLSALGADPDAAQLLGTPERVADSYAELLSGEEIDAAALLQNSMETADVADASDPIVVRDIEFVSVCEHHLLPFRGICSIAYVPGKYTAGFGSLARVVAAYAKRLQMQERLTAQIADTLHDALQAEGVLVLISATHGCLSDRGPVATGATAVTLAARGALDATTGEAGRAAHLAALTLLGTPSLDAREI